MDTDDEFDGNNQAVEEEEDDEEEEEEEDEDGGTVARSMDNEGASDILNATADLASLSDPERSLTVREIGHEAVWSLSTAKPGNGVAQIRDSSVDTYWQSDGGQPHLINIQFPKRAAVCEVAFYLDYSLDESYTPKKLSIRTGLTFHDLEEIKVVELNEPVGWCSVHLTGGLDPLDEIDEVDGKNSEQQASQKSPVRTHFIQIYIVSMHQNGRDTHIRQVKIFGPRAQGTFPERRAQFGCEVPAFQTVEMSQFSTIR